MSASSTAAATESAINIIQLTGRINAIGEPKVLPSGAAVVTMRLVVPRVASAADREGRRATVDTIELACWSAATRRRAERLTVGDHVSVEGALRHRYFRTGPALQSRYEVEVATIRKLPAARSGAAGN